MLSVKAKYALQAITYIARVKPGQPVLIAEVAKHEGIPRKFLECILLELKNEGLLDSRRGKGGGYLLNIPPSSIKIARVVKAIEGPLPVPSCTRDGTARRCDSCDGAGGCPLRIVLTGLADSISKSLGELTIAELLNQGSSESVTI